MSNFKFIRIIFLLIVLAFVWKHFDSQKKSINNWDVTQDIVIIPINFDQLDTTKKAISNLNESQFEDIDQFIADEARKYNLSLDNSVSIRLGNTISSKPPALPRINSSRWDIALWSLKLRWWSYKNKPNDNHTGQVRLYVMYSSPKPNQRLPHSTGLQKGLIGLIHASAHKKDRKRNNMIITHELMHIFGASDKYDLATGHPIFPDGFANPNKNNPFPQSKAEIMAGRIPLSKSEFGRVYGLSQTIIGEKTAIEIGWLQSTRKN